MMNNNQDTKLFKDGEEVTITDTISLNPDRHWLIGEYVHEYKKFVNHLIFRLNHSELRKHPTTTWESYNLTKPIFELINNSYRKYVDSRIMYYNLIQFLQRQLEKLQAEYYTINSQGMNKKRSFIITMKDKVVAIMTTYVALKDIIDYSYIVEQSIINAKKLETNLMQFLKGEKQ